MALIWGHQNFSDREVNIFLKDVIKHVKKVRAPDFLNSFRPQNFEVRSISPKSSHYSGVAEFSSLLITVARGI